MTRCEKCRYALVRDRCPMCGGRKLNGVPALVEKAQAAPVVIADVLPLYWSPGK